MRGQRGPLPTSTFQRAQPQAQPGQPRPSRRRSTVRQRRHTTPVPVSRSIGRCRCSLSGVRTARHYTTRDNACYRTDRRVSSARVQTVEPQLHGPHMHRSNVKLDLECTDRTYKSNLFLFRVCVTTQKSALCPTSTPLLVLRATPV